MPRKARKQAVSNIYHVVTKGIDRQLLFEETKDYKKYLEILSLYKEECGFELYAFCLMSNHIHLLIRIKDNPLETIFRKINTHYATWFNMKYQRTGPLQDGRFYSEPVEDNLYLITAAKYIHLNPSKAGLETTPGESYPWSSIYEYKSFAENLVDTNFIYSITTPDSFLYFKETDIKEDIFDIEKARKRLPDDVAKDIIISETGCENAAEFQKLTLKQRNSYIRILKQKGLSISQLNRLTGVSIGVIKRIKVKDSSSDNRTVPMLI